MTVAGQFQERQQTVLEPTALKRSSGQQQRAIYFPPDLLFLFLYFLRGRYREDAHKIYIHSTGFLLLTAYLIKKEQNNNDLMI